MLETLNNYRRYGDSLHTSAQPDADQLGQLQRAGIELVINLALVDSPDAVADEAALIENQGLPYIHIPVDFKQPLASDFRQFADVMEQHPHAQKLVHCAYNWRVSCFVYLYRVLYQHIDLATAEQDLHSVWTPDETWQAFIDSCIDNEAQEETGA